MSTINAIQEKLTITSANLSLISDNIANVNTPEYQRKYIDVHGANFGSTLHKKLKQTHSKHIDNHSSDNISINEVEAYMRTDGNGVDIDEEVVELNKNKLFYNSLVTLMNNDIANLKSIITSKP